MRNDMRDHNRAGARDGTHHDAGIGSWRIPLVVLVALALGGLIYAFISSDSNIASDQQGAPSASTTGSGAGTTGSGTGLTGEQTGAATTQTPRGAATGGGGAASR